MRVFSFLSVVVVVFAAFLIYAEILPKGSLNPEPYRTKFEELVSETAGKVQMAENAVTEFRKLTAGRKGAQSRVDFFLEQTLEKVDRNNAAIKDEERRLRKIRDFCEKGASISHPIDGHVLTQDEISEQIEVSITRLKALRITAVGLDKQRKFATDKVAEFRADASRAPIYLVELEAALDSLKVQYALQKDQLRMIDQTGTVHDLATAYADAKVAISDAFSRFDSLMPSSSFVQIDFPDEETAGDYSARHVGKINEALGIISSSQECVD